MALARRLSAEFIGTAILVAAVVGSGIMAERLAGGNIALALLGNTLPTGAILVVLITIFGPVSGAHFNPAVSLVSRARKEMNSANLTGYVVAQVAGGILGTLAAHLMFDDTLFQLSAKMRSGPAQWLSEGVAAFGLVLTILGTARSRPAAVSWTVGLYIVAAYWFTASTSFANPAVTIARTFTGSFSGIAPGSVPLFICSQLAGAMAADRLCRWLFSPDPSSAYQPLAARASE